MNCEELCPKCGYELIYGIIEDVDDTIQYPCECGKCSFKGFEVYNVELSHHTDRDGNLVEVKRC
jgi:hypothetical protein